MNHQPPHGPPQPPLYSPEWAQSLSPADREELVRLMTPRLNRFIPQMPHPPQAAFLLLPDSEALYGGAAGGGKSSALLMAALQYVDVPGYAALIVRRNYTQLTKADGLIERSRAWLTGTGAKWNEQQHKWTFPSGATLEFGHCEHEASKWNYQGSAWQFIGFDELTQFTETMYTYIGLSRRRRLEGSIVPVRTRASANPGGEGHDWVKARFVDPVTRTARFVPARLEDNPSLDGEDYRKSLSSLTTIERDQLLHGNWDVRPKGPLFDRLWFEIVDQAPTEGRVVRFWDLAATEPEKGKDPDWTVGVRLKERNGLYWIEHVARAQRRPEGIEQLVWQTAMSDGHRVKIGMEQEGGSAGKNNTRHYATLLKGCSFKGMPSTGSKYERASLWQPAAERRDIKLVKGAWNQPWLDCVEAFPHGSHDDDVDGMSGAYEMQSEHRKVFL